jgi:REP element-mobilizing transposase RayT
MESFSEGSVSFDAISHPALARRSPQRKQLRPARLRAHDQHVHLLLTPPQPQDVPRLIISLGRGYVRYINKTYHRTGTLWDSRYTSSLVQEDTY